MTPSDQLFVCGVPEVSGGGAGVRGGGDTVQLFTKSGWALQDRAHNRQQQQQQELWWQWWHASGRLHNEGSMFSRHSSRTTPQGPACCDVGVGRMVRPVPAMGAVNMHDVAIPLVVAA